MYIEMSSRNGDTRTISRRRPIPKNVYPTFVGWFVDIHFIAC